MATGHLAAGEAAHQLGVPRAPRQHRHRELLILIYETHSSAPVEVVWPLLAQPGQWSRWAPHIRGALGLGRPEVQAGRIGLVLLGVALPVPAQITAKQPGRSWDWRVGPVDMRHEVIGTPDGSAVRIEMAAPGPVQAGLRIGYGPLVELLLNNLARIAAVSPSRSRQADPPLRHAPGQDGPTENAA